MVFEATINWSIGCKFFLKELLVEQDFPRQVVTMPTKFVSVLIHTFRTLCLRQFRSLNNNKRVKIFRIAAPCFLNFKWCGDTYKIKSDTLNTGLLKSSLYSLLRTVIKNIKLSLKGFCKGTFELVQVFLM